MRNKLLSHLYSGFNQDPDPILAFEIWHPDGAAWNVKNRQLVVSTDAGSVLTSINLESVGTVWDVVCRLMDVGVRVSRINADTVDSSALILMDGAGRESQYTNSIYGYRSALWGLLEGYATEVQSAWYAVPQALEQARLHSADDDWLDLWGSYFGVTRRSGQADASYLATIVAETLRAKSNRYAIENAVLDVTGSQVQITEPWQSIFRLDASALSGAHALHDGVVVGHHLIRPLIPSGSDWDAVMAVIERTRAAGVLISNPVRIVPASLVPAAMPITPNVWASRFFDHTFLVGKINANALGRLVLDGDRPAINHLVAMFSLGSLGNAQGVNNDQHMTPWRSVAKASVALSDGFALGNLNAVLGRGQLVRRILPVPSLSGLLALSGASAVTTIDRVTEIVFDAHGALLLLGATVSQCGMWPEICMSYMVRLNEDTGWTGFWTADRAWHDQSVVGMAISQST